MSAHRRPLAGVDWNFPAANSTYGVHGLHWYPASFIPQIPAYLIELFSQPGDLVLDPFAGSGASLVEAVRLGRRSVGLDLNPIAVLIAQAKLLLLTDWPWEAEVEALVKRLEADRLRSEILAGAVNSDATGLSPGLVEAQKWYHPMTFRQLRLILQHIEDAPHPARTVFRAAFSSILKKASGQTEHWGYVADNMVPSTPEHRDAFALFIRTLRDVIRVRAETAPGVVGVLSPAEMEQQAVMIEGNVLSGKLPAAGTVNLVVTSPPYIGVTDYSRSQRLSMYWLGYDLDTLGREEIGARWKRFRRSHALDYIEEMQLACCRVVETLRMNGHLAIVVGAPIARDTAHSVLASLRDILTALNLKLVDETSRMLSRQRLVDRAGTKNPEIILVYEKCR
ncbi:hypothetical protein BH23GEM5_BH23GEM5_02330 [soil metagenome]